MILGIPTTEGQAGAEQEELRLRLMGLNFTLEAVVMELKGSNMRLAWQGQMYIFGNYFSLQMGMDGRRGQG